MGSVVALIIFLNSILKVLASIIVRSRLIADSISVAKRLPCVIPIASDGLTHDGLHIHTTDPNPFHYCEAR
jgi:hypothetical protein